MRKVNKNVLAATTVVLMLLSFIPLLMLARYTKPIADDFGYGGPVYYAIKNGGGFLDVINAVIENIRYTYLNWQGTFTSVFLFSIQPDALFEGLYVITPIVMILAIISSIYLLISLMNIDGWGKVFIGSVVSLIAVQFLPSVAEGIYWWNGASHYIACWFLLTVLIYQQVRILNKNSFEKKFILNVFFACFCAFCVGGCNYSIALAGTTISSMMVICSILKKKERKIIYAEFMVAFFCIIALVVSMVAPGNSIRQSALEKTGVISAILTSFSEAFKAILSYTDITIIFALLLCIPIFLMALKKREYIFRPLLVLCLSFCVFSSLYTPPLYAMSFCDVPRMNNMFYLAYLVLIFGNCFYIAGWLYCKYSKLNNKIIKTTAIIGAVALLLTLTMQAKHTNSFLAFTDLKSDTLQTYTREVVERKAVHKDKTASLRFTPISEYPKCFAPSKQLTWSSDLLLNDVPIDIPIYRSCGGEITYVGYDDVAAYFNVTENLALKNFTKTFYIDGKICVPLREVSQKLGWSISYDALCDTIYIVSVK